MANLLQRAINSKDGDSAAKIIHDALGIESDEVAHYCFPNMARGPRAARPHYWRLAASGSALCGLNNVDGQPTRSKRRTPRLGESTGIQGSRKDLFAACTNGNYERRATTLRSNCPALPHAGMG